jgi:hypothetical protein
VEVKVTLDFQRQHRKNLVSAQCVTCSGGLVITNFEIPASKFPIVVSGSKYAQLFYFFHEIQKTFYYGVQTFHIFMTGNHILFHFLDRAFSSDAEEITNKLHD